jgi:hypothetical protein
VTTHVISGETRRVPKQKDTDPLLLRLKELREGMAEPGFEPMSESEFCLKAGLSKSAISMVRQRILETGNPGSMTRAAAEGFANLTGRSVEWILGESPTVPLELTIAFANYKWPANFDAPKRQQVIEDIAAQRFVPGQKVTVDDWTKLIGAHVAATRGKARPRIVKDE